jgi:hypothetical protein
LKPTREFCRIFLHGWGEGKRDAIAVSMRKRLQALEVPPLVKAKPDWEFEVVQDLQKDSEVEQI